MIHLISNTCFRLPSINKTRKNRTYSVKINVEKYSVSLLIAKMNRCTGQHYLSTIIRYCVFTISYNKKEKYVLFIIFFVISDFSILFYTRYYFLSLILLTGIEDLREQRYANKFFKNHFVSDPLDKALILSPLAQCTHLCNKIISS